MPIYEYKCLKCGKVIEKMQKVSDEPLTVCEECGGKLEKQWSLSGFQFKGAGWYVTDYSGKKAESKAESKTEAAPKADSSEKKSDNDSTGSAKSASNSTKTADSGSKKD